MIKATQPFEKLSIDFKVPLPTSNQNKNILTICDEYSRFPFAFPCRDRSAKSVMTHLRVFAVFGMPAYLHSDSGGAFMRHELKQFLHSKGIARSRTTSYNPSGNGQEEKLNGMTRIADTLALKTHKLPINAWQDVLPDVPDAHHSLCTLLCTSTNLHERLFVFQRRSTTRSSIPLWLATTEPILLKHYVRLSKFDPLVDEVGLIEANPRYAYIRFPDGREDTVALKHLAPKNEDTNHTLETPSRGQKPKQNNVNEPMASSDINKPHTTAADISTQDSSAKPAIVTENENETMVVPENKNEAHQPPTLRRSQRVRRPPDRYNPINYA